MTFSVHLPTAAEGLAHPVGFAEPADLLALARQAEDLGFDGVWGNSHVTTQDYLRSDRPDAGPPRFYDVLLVLAAVAAVTSRVHLGTAVVVPSMHLAPTLAKAAATLDGISGGRFRLGLGVGAYREEFTALWPGTRGVHRGRWLDETIEALDALFTQPVASYDGEFVRFDAVRSFPKPVQQPLPLYIGGHNEQAIDRAARHGTGWLPGWQPLPELARRIALLRDREAAAGRSGAVEVAPQLSVTLARTSAQAEADYWGSELVAHRASLSYTGRDLGQQVAANLIGSPQQVVDKVGALAEIGVQHCCALWFSTSTVQEMSDQMAWFAQEVIHEFR